MTSTLSYFTKIKQMLKLQLKFNRSKVEKYY